MTIHPRMTKATASLIVSQPFFGTLACNLDFQEANLRTMATDGRHLFYSTKFLGEIDDAEVLFVVAHEVLHCALFHCTRRGDRDPKLWNIACDYVVNSTLVIAKIGRMPKCGLYDPKYTGWSSEEVYRDLESQAKSKSKQGGQPGEGEPGQEDDPGGCGAVLDAADDAGGIAEMEAEWQVIVREAVNIATKHAGKVPAYLEGIVGELKKAKQDWRVTLRRFVDPCSKYDYSWTVPDRRFAGQPFILPGTVTDGISHVAWLVDTSGSMDIDALNQGGGELNSLIEQGFVDKVTVVYSDCAVQRVDTFENGDAVKFDPPRGGGTNFGPAIDWVSENLPDVVCAIYFTDLDGPFGKEPAFPVLWAVYGDPRYQRNREVPFGEMVAIDD